MNAIEFISAGAGSGKTYLLTDKLADAVSSGTARPDAIVATTFTVKAARELRERSRQHLLQSGRIDLANALGQARIGTVHSVCGQLLKQFCFELGLSPEQEILDEAEAWRLIDVAIEDAVDDELRQEYLQLVSRLSMEGKEWSKPIRNILDAVRSNDIAPASLGAMAEANAAAMLANWPAPDGSADWTKLLVEAIAKAESDLGAAIEALQAAGKNVQQNTQKAFDELRTWRRQFANGSWSWNTWISATTVNAGVNARPLVLPVIDAAKVHERHPEFHADVRRFLTLSFLFVERALAQFDQRKRELGVMDFADQEVLVLRALRASDSVRRVIAEQLDLVLVDEFQDTSPIQLAIFVELAKLAKQSIWVGDPKQSIFGFRGTDPELIHQVIQAVESWGGKLGEPLTVSRRSTPSLVKLVNEVFVPVFAPPAAPEAVRLTPIRNDIPDQPAILDWAFHGGARDTHFTGLGVAVKTMLSSGFRVEDRSTGQLRPLEPGDIGVLCRRKTDIPNAVASLVAHGIPAASSQPGLMATPEAVLVVACLRRLHDRGDTLATALIVALTENAAQEAWLADRLAYLARGEAPEAWKEGTGPDGNEIVRRLDTVRSRLSGLSPSEAMRLARSESQVHLHATRWSTTTQQTSARLANVDALVQLAASYEDICRSARRPATVGGLLVWLTALERDGEDHRAASRSAAVEVLTHHAAKGLEWPVAILTGLGDTAWTALWGVRARTEGNLDPANPLLHRTIHYWPNPYGKARSVPSWQNAALSETGVRMEAEALAESKRLLYTSFTRARDGLVLVSIKTSRGLERGWVQETKADWLFHRNATIDFDDGTSVKRVHQELDADQCAAAPEPPVASTSWDFVVVPPRDHLPLWVRPSKAAGTDFEAGAIEGVGSRMPLRVPGDMTSLGLGIHNCIAAYWADPGQGLPDAVADAILARWGVAPMLEVKDLQGQVAALAAWLAGKWPAATIRAEVPIEAGLPDGQRLRGQIDLLVDTAAGWIIVDHKSDPRGTGDGAKLAVLHGGQLFAYARALAAITGRPVIECWLFLPVAGAAVQVVERQ